MAYFAGQHASRVVITHVLGGSNFSTVDQLSCGEVLSRTGCNFA